MAPHGALKRKRERESQITKTSKSQQGVMEDSQPSALLKLPGEIRNKIWAHTFDYYDYVNCGRRIDTTCFRRFPNMPVAATVCCQMMAEVLGVFHNATTFIIWIDNCEGERDVRANTAYMRLCNIQCEIGNVENAPTSLSEATNRPAYRISGRPAFDNIIKWAKNIHSTDLDLNYDPSEADGWAKTLCEMLQTAVKMRSSP